MKRIVFLLCAVVAGSAAYAAGPDVIKIGMVNPQTGPNKGSGRGMKVGVHAYFKAVNEKGGVKGKKLELINLDDQYITEKTIDGLLKLVEEHKVLATVGSVGSSNCTASIPLVKEYHLPYINPRCGMDMRIPVTREIINVRASYQQEVDRAVDALVKEAGAKRFAVFYQNDTLGVEILRLTENAVKRHGLTLVSKGMCEKLTTAVTAGLASVIAGNPDAVFIGAVAAPAGAFINLAVKEGLKARFAIASYAAGPSLIKAAGAASAEGTIMTQVVPPLSDLSLPITKECKEAIEKNPEDEGFNVVTMEGCMAAKSIVMALEKTGDPLTSDALIKAYESMKDADLGGIKLTFTPDNHQGQDNVYMAVVQDGKLTYPQTLKK